MISSIAAVAAVALVSYVLFPHAGSLWVRYGWVRVLRRFRTEQGLTGICTGFADGKLRMQSAAPNAAPDIGILPGHTLFYILRKNGEIERLDWKTVFLLQTGTTLLFIPPKKRFVRGICIFYEEKSSTVLAGQLRNLSVPEEISNPAKPYSIAAGAFAEFLLFLAYQRHPETGSAAVAALVAIFGIALPYLPPGLVLTLAARPGSKHRTGAKKSRQHRVAGFLLVTAGILLNIGIVFLVIRRIGF